MTAIVTIATGLAFPEGPAVAHDGTIWVSELRGGGLARIDADGTITRRATGGTPNGLAFASDRSLWFCDADGAVRRLDLITGALATIASTVDGVPLAAPNDLAFAPDDSLVFSCPGDSRLDPTGYICRLDAASQVKRIAEGLLFPNGLCFSADGARLFVAETYGLAVRAAGWPGGDPLSLQPLFDTPGPIGADGVAVTREGWVATSVHGAGLLRISDADGGNVRDVTLPDARPAGCCADPLGRWSLIITGTEHGQVMGVTL